MVEKEYWFNHFEPEDQLEFEEWLRLREKELYPSEVKDAEEAQALASYVRDDRHAE